MMRSLSATVLMIITCLAAGCKKEETVKTKKVTNISNTQAATMVATSLALNSYGLAGVKNDVIFYAKNLGTTTGKGCGVEDSFSIAKQEFATSNINYNYALGYHFTVNCDGNVQDNLTGKTIYNGSFDAANLSSIYSSTSTINVMQLADASAVNYNLNGIYQTTGTFQTIDETQLAGNNGLNITINDLLIKKTDRSIVSGTANVTVSGTIKSNKNNFGYSGTIIFNNAQTATLDLEGIKYKIDLTTADVTAL